MSAGIGCTLASECCGHQTQKKAVWMSLASSTSGQRRALAFGVAFQTGRYLLRFDFRGVWVRRLPCFDCRLVGFPPFLEEIADLVVRTGPNGREPRLVVGPLVQDLAVLANLFPEPGYYVGTDRVAVLILQDRADAADDLVAK